MKFVAKYINCVKSIQHIQSSEFGQWPPIITTIFVSLTAAAAAHWGPPMLANVRNRRAKQNRRPGRVARWSRHT